MSQAVGILLLVSVFLLLFATIVKDVGFWPTVIILSQSIGGTAAIVLGIFLTLGEITF